MTGRIWLLGLVVFSNLTATDSVFIQAVAAVRNRSGSIQGNLTFSQSEGGKVTIFGKIIGLKHGLHGIHIHETGDITSPCSLTGFHYNPFKRMHGDLKDAERHLGDLGNIEAGVDGKALVAITDNLISLTGPYMILGRSIVVHENKDDLGKGKFPDSYRNGHSGVRIACGVIGLRTPVDKFSDFTPCTRGNSILPMKTLLLFLLVIIRLNY